MTLKLCAVTINSSRPSELQQFYTILGFQFKEMQVKRGGAIFRAVMNNIEFTIFPHEDKVAPTHPFLQLAFQVADVDAMYLSLIKAGAGTLLEPTDLPDGKRAIIKDLEGNSVELIQL